MAAPTLPQADEIRALAATLVTPQLVVFPVRHHSPACAWHLRQVFETLSPSVVLVEGPRSFTSQVPLLTHAEARMPLALYTYIVRKDGDKGEAVETRRAAFYPFCDYSPELVALREAQARGLPARFIDLDFAEQCAIETDEEDEARSLLDERHYRRSRYLAALADRLGCRDHDEMWEHLFEVPADTRSLDEHIAQVAAYCHLARFECTQEELTVDGTLAREAEMAWHIRQALAERKDDAGPVLAVVGGFHAVVLPQQVSETMKRPSVARGNVSDEASSLIRYSFERLDRLNGYSAGMTSPAWHQLIWDKTLAHERAGLDRSPRRRRDAVLGVLSDIAAELRGRHGLPLPVPALAAAYEQALRLAALRQRAAPVRDDVMDAVTSCFVKGDTDADGAIVLSVARRILGGQAMGRVPPGATTPPLVKDFQYRARRQRLKIDDPEPRKAVLDLYRRPEHRLTSRLLHGLVFLGIPFASRIAGPDFVNGVGLDRIQEHWEYTHSVATEAALVEASMYGVTLPLAVANRFLTRLDAYEAEGKGRDARTASALMMQACVLGLHDHLPRLLAGLRRSIGEDASFDSVADAAGSLGLLLESREPLEARGIDELPELLQAAYERVIFLGRGLRGAKDDGSDTVHALSKLRELVVSESGRSLDATLYWEMVAALRAEHDSALIRGAAAGLLYGAGRLDEAELGRTLEGHLGGLSQPRDAVSFLRGLLSTAREAAWQQPALLGVLDDMLKRWDENAFVASLPELRLAFAALTPKETDRVAGAVARLHGAEDLGRLVRYDLSDADVQEHLAMTAVARELLVADGLGEWIAR